MSEAHEVAVDELQRATSAHPTGVAVVLSAAADGLHGTCVGTFTRVSLDPPLVSVCVRRGGRTRGLLGLGEAFGVSVLSSDQQALAETFSAPRQPGDPAPECGGLSHRAGSVTLAESAAGFHCTVTQAVEAGDHVIVLGRVHAAWRRPRTPALVHLHGQLIACHSTGDASLGPAVRVA